MLQCRYVYIYISLNFNTLFFSFEEKYALFHRRTMELLRSFKRKHSSVFPWPFFEKKFGYSGVSRHNRGTERKRKKGAIVRNGLEDIRAAAQVAGYFGAERDLSSCSGGRKDARNGGRNLAHYGAS